jgi:hypothetical protein
MDTIGAAILRMEETASAIAAAMEQQTAATREIARSIGLTASHADEVAQLMGSVKASAGRASEVAVAVNDTADAINGSMDALGRIVAKAVRSSLSLAERRTSERRAVMLDAVIVAQGRRVEGRVYDLSEGGAMVQAAADVPSGTAVVLRVAAEGLELPGSVRHAGNGSLHIAFTNDGLSAARVDAIAGSSVARIVEVTKVDHRNFVQSIMDAVSGQISLDPSGLNTHHTCRLGKWYDSVADDRLLACPAFIELQKPHRAVHAAGHAALVALMSASTEAVENNLALLHTASAEVISLLDRMGAELPQRGAA